jgi:DNA-binding transcriptional LysR family regulator
VTLEACRRAGFTSRFAVEGGEMDAVLAFVEPGLGVALVPSMMLLEHIATVGALPWGPGALIVRVPGYGLDTS